MAIPSKDDLAQWAYIQSIYNFINKERKRLSIGADLAIPNYQDEKFSPKQMSDIQSEIEQFNNNVYVKNNSEVQTSISSIRIPNKDDFIKVLPFEDTMDKISRVCTYDSSYRGGYRGSYDGGYRGGQRGSYDAGYNSADRGGVRGVCSYRSGDRTPNCFTAPRPPEPCHQKSHRASHYSQRRDLKPTR